MLVASALLFLRVAVVSDPQTLLDGLKSALDGQSQPRVESYFARKEDAAYLFKMAEKRGGLKTVKVKVIPAPPGWPREGGYWAVFHTVQDIEDEHDPIYTVIRTGDGLKLGREIPEWTSQSVVPEHAQIDARIRPAEKTVEVQAFLRLKRTGERKAPVFRLQDLYKVSGVMLDSATTPVVEAGDTVPSVPQGSVLRAGSLLIPFTTDPIGAFEARYKGVLAGDKEDHINSKLAYVTAWWVPSIARLPFTTDVRITAPRGWVMRSEGPRGSNDAMSTQVEREQTEVSQTYSCPFPISYPKIIAGAYEVAAELQDGERTFRSYQFAPVDKARGEKDVRKMAESVRFYEKHLVPFPFSSYECFDGDGYYGIESYSYTLLAKNITTWAVDHEIGHTYFGGLTPSGYVRDSWNEGVTTYVDDIVTGKLEDRPYDGAIRGIGVTTPLSKLGVPYDFDGLSYNRGAYVMKMLEEEIGQPNVLAGLRGMLANRVGKDTVWGDLRQYFEKSSGQKLDWFWSQWIDNGAFPTLKVLKTRKLGSGQTEVLVEQSGTPRPFRLRFALLARRGGQTKKQVVTMREPQGLFTISSEFDPEEVVIDQVGYTMVKTAK